MADEPHFWMHETSGVLAPVIEAYLQGRDLTPSQLAIMRLYLHQWIDAPVWSADGDIEALRQSVDQIATRADLERWLDKALDLGIDPL
jgi:hypothetical protein